MNKLFVRLHHSKTFFKVTLPLFSHKVSLLLIIEHIPVRYFIKTGSIVIVHPPMKIHTNYLCIVENR